MSRATFDSDPRPPATSKASAILPIQLRSSSFSRTYRSKPAGMLARSTATQAQEDRNDDHADRTRSESADAPVSSPETVVTKARSALGSAELLPRLTPPP
ncbi:hypothetical protein HP467_08130 [Curtobacterium albidum]|uniref:Uncharacterized protein n=1 Tax=Curtobacterium citreum TaxID=2036 RepID=A0A850DV89_9MICO|nr:hypothetical protein [Curtobacterium albidum]NUU28080.1 hypothetical protein [Curtobacterium albidum]